MPQQTQIHNPWDPTRPSHFAADELAQGGANARQEGGSHYKAHKYETWDVIIDWNLGYLDGNAVKYLSRWRLKNGIEDLKKARHYIDKLIETLEADRPVPDVAVYDRGPRGP